MKKLLLATTAIVALGVGAASAADMAVKARAENKKLTSMLETLQARIVALEAASGKIPGEDPLEAPGPRTRRTAKGDPQK